MPVQVIAHEGRDEIIAVVVSRLPPQRQRNVGLGTGRLQQFRTKLLFQEIIGLTDIDEKA